MILIVAQKALNIYYNGFLAVIMTNKEPISPLLFVLPKHFNNNTSGLLSLIN